MPLKEFLVKKLSLKLNVSERIIDTVISNQFSSAFQATAHHNTIELSGFGKFIFSPIKANKQMAKYIAQKALYEADLSDPSHSPEKVRNLNMRLATVLKNIEHLKTKMPNEPKSDI
jgi:hypothetical protein